MIFFYNLWARARHLIRNYIVLMKFTAVSIHSLNMDRRVHEPEIGEKKRVIKLSSCSTQLSMTF